MGVSHPDMVRRHVPVPALDDTDTESLANLSSPVSNVDYTCNM